jgi:hypothetical protein
MGDRAMHYFTFEWPEDDEPEVDVNVNHARAMTDESFRRRNDGVETEAQTSFVNHLVRILFIDEVFDGSSAWLIKLRWMNLDYVRQSNLNCDEQPIICELSEISPVNTCCRARL